MHGADVVQLRQVSTDSSSDQQSKCSPTRSTMEQPTVIISQSSRIQSVGHPLTNLSLQPHISYGSAGDLEQPLSYHQHSTGESSPLMHHQGIDQHQNVWSYSEDAAVQQHQYSQRSLVITQTPLVASSANHFSADGNEMRDHLHLHHLQYPATTMDDNNNHTLHHQTVDEVIHNTLKDEDHCIHASPISHHGGSPGSHHGSPEHGHSGSGNVQFLNLGSAQSTISENLSKFKYPRHQEQQHPTILVATHSESRSSPVSQVSEYESDLQNFTQLTSVVQSRNNNNLAIFSPTSQAGGYENVNLR